ncbi:MAG: class I SAM-dependent methyltransferase [bacterium]
MNNILLADEWKDYELIDSANGEKLERWGQYILRRPDGQAIWPLVQNDSNWENADAVYTRSTTGGGFWKFKKQIDERWIIGYKNLKFFVEPTGFKHTGLFPEQAVNWDWMMEKILNVNNKNSGRRMKVLNLFGYTGAASVACSVAGADVVHVDASKGMNMWAKENYDLNYKNGVGEVRFITDDVKKFVQREIRRGNKYDGIIMDPPVYGRGPKGELWEIEKEIGPLIQNCSELLTDKSLFLIVNSYTASFSHIALANVLNNVVYQQYRGNIVSGEIGIKARKSGVILPCGLYGKWYS